MAGVTGRGGIPSPVPAPIEGDLLVFNGSTWETLSPATDGHVLTSQGPGVAPAFEVLPSLPTDAGLVSLATADSGAGLAYVTGANTWARLTLGANLLPYATAAGAMATTTLSAYARTLLDDADAAAMQVTLGLVIGTNVLAYDAGITSLTSADSGAGLAYVTSANTWARLSLSADKGIYATGAGALAVFDLTAFGRSLIDDADAAAARTTLGIAAALRQASLVTRREWHCNTGGGTTPVAMNATGSSLTGTLAAVFVTGSARVYQSVTTTTTIANEAGFESVASSIGMCTEVDTTFYCFMRTPADRTNSRIFVGFGVNGVSNSDTVGNDSLIWRLAPGDTKWNLCGKATGAQQDQPTGPNVGNSTEYVLRCRYDRANAKAYGAVSTDGGATWSTETEVTTIATASQNMPPICRVVNVAGVVTASMQWSGIQMFQTLDAA